MFSGIVEEYAEVVRVVKDLENLHLTLTCSFVDELKIDQSVSHNGTLPDKRGDLTVQVGILKIKTNISSIAPHKEEKKKQKVQTYFSSERAVSTVKSEIDLRGETADDALLLTDKYLDDAVLAHLETVSIIHGKGTGVLRQVISDMLRHHPHVKSYRSGRYGEGESGVTIVELK